MPFIHQLPWETTACHPRPTHPVRFYPSLLSTYLSEWALESPKLIDAPGRNADHGGQSKKPPQRIPPPRVCVLLVVGQGCIFDQGEQEGCLEGNGRHRDWCWSSVPSATHIPSYPHSCLVGFVLPAGCAAGYLGQSVSKLHPHSTQSPLLGSNFQCPSRHCQAFGSLS